MFLRSALSFGLLMLSASCVPPIGPEAGAIGITRSASDTSRRVSYHAVLPPPEIMAAAIAPGHPAAPFRSGDQSEDAARNSLRCLTDAVYYEARSQSEDGQRAVAQVVLNRVRHPAFPSSICGVVYQGSERSTGCQFSFTCDGSRNRRIEQTAWARASRIAEEALAGQVYAPVGLATHFHTTAIRPWWAGSLTRAVTVGSHIFYRWRGEWGNPKAFRQPYSGEEWGNGLGKTENVKEGARVQTLSFGVRVHRSGADAAIPSASAGIVRVHRSGGIKEVKIRPEAGPDTEESIMSADSVMETTPAPAS